MQGTISRLLAHECNPLRLSVSVRRPRGPQPPHMPASRRSLEGKRSRCWPRCREILEMPKYSRALNLCQGGPAVKGVNRGGGLEVAEALAHQDVSERKPGEDRWVERRKETRMGKEGFDTRQGVNSGSVY